MHVVDLISRWFHILPAIALVGGTIFMRFAYLPAIMSMSDEQREVMQSAVRSRWSKVVMISAALLIISGLYNAMGIMMNNKLPGYYHGLFGAKLLLAVFIFFLASVVAGRSDTAKKFQSKESMWLGVNVVLAILLVGVAGSMRLAKRTPKEAEPEPTSLIAPLNPTSMN